MTNKRKSSGYQVCVHVGARPDGLDPDIRFVELSPDAATPDAVLAALSATDLNPSDFRAEALCAFDTERDLAVLVYAAVLGFAQRRVDVVASGRLVQATRVDKLARALPDAGKPDPVPTQVQVGAVAHPDLPSVLFSAQVPPEQVSSVRFARRVRFAPSGEPAEALAQLLIVAGIRARGHVDRFPFLVSGDEPAPSIDAPLEVAGICLDTLRSGAVDLRRSHRSGDRRTIVAQPVPSERRSLLSRAGSIDIEEALVLLGGRQNPDTGLWHCPRPDRHSNGDANASMRTVKGLVRCYRCDGERVDALRLAMDVLGLSPDDAAEWLLERLASRSSEELNALFG
jgi:hypothetical protein